MNTEALSDHRYYDLALKMVLWDEPRAKIVQRLRANQVSPDEIKALMGIAERERLRVIRKEFGSRLALGIVLLAVSVGVFIALWFGLGMITRGVLVLCAIILAFALWKFVSGLSGLIMAKQVKGPVADDF